MIAILTPSRHRRAQFVEMVEAVFSTADDPASIRVYLGTDDDDWSYLPTVYAGSVHHVSGPRKPLGGWTNYLARIALEDGAEIVASFGDDHRPRTRGWDARTWEAFTRLGSGLVYTRDGLQDERLPTAPLWSADVIRELGWMFPPNQKHMYVDNFWLQFAQDLERCVYLPDVLIEHMHPSSGKATEDDVNRENDSHYEADRAAFAAFIGSAEYQDCLSRARALL